jgi:ribose-phosphate pyrophosphokinase
MLYINGQPVPITLFPDNTSQCWKLPEEILTPNNQVGIEWRFSHEGEFMHLAQLKALLDEYGVISKLKISYLPYGRQDKGTNNSTTFALFPFADLLNSLDFNDVEIVDPHSSMALDWIANSHATYPIQKIKEVMAETGTTLVCYPDKGAVTKYTKVYDELVGTAYIYGEKVRDQLTGNITSYQIVGDPANHNVLIIDDICDYGRTFILLAKDLLSAGAKEVNLFVTHGLFSGGTKVLKKAGINRIFSKDGEPLSDRIRSQI